VAFQSQAIRPLERSKIYKCEINLVKGETKLHSCINFEFNINLMLENAAPYLQYICHQLKKICVYIFINVKDYLVRHLL